MLNKKILSSIFLLLLSISVYTQNIRIEENLSVVIEENFNNDNSQFPIITNIENYFILDNGDYLLSRNNKESEYAIFPSTNASLNNFKLQTSIKLGPSSNKYSSAGILLKAQINGSSALVFEINRKSEFRIKKLINGTYNYLSGNNNNNGWVKNKSIKGENQYNDIEVLSIDNSFDIYVNNNFLTSIYSPELQNGKMGIMIGNESKARISYFYLYNSSTETNSTVEKQKKENTIANLLIRINELESRNKNLDQTIIRLENDLNLIEPNQNYITKLEDSLEKIEFFFQIAAKDAESLRIKNESLNETLNQKENLIYSKEDLEVEINKIKFQISKKDEEINNLYAEKGEIISESKDAIKSIETKLNNKIIEENNKFEILKNRKTKSTDSLNLIIEKKLIETKKKSEEISELHTKIDNIKNIEIAANLEIENLKKQNDKNLKIITEIENKLSSKEDAINDLKSKNKKFLETKKTLEDIKKENQILNKKIKNELMKTEELNSKILNLNNEINTSKLDKSKYIDKNTILNINSKKKDAKIASLEKEVDLLKKEKNILNETINTNKTYIANIKTFHTKELEKSNTLIQNQNTRINNMIEVLKYKGFDEKGIISSEAKVTNKNEEKIVIKNETIYSVQIGSFGSKVNIKQFNGLMDVFYYDTKNGSFLYMSGRFTNTNEAVTHKNNLIKLGYKDAFIVTLNEKQ